MVGILLSFDVLYCSPLLERKSVWFVCKFLVKTFEQRNVRVGGVSMMSAESEGNEEKQKRPQLFNIFSDTRRTTFVKPLSFISLFT